MGDRARRCRTAAPGFRRARALRTSRRRWERSRPVRSPRDSTAASATGRSPGSDPPGRAGSPRCIGPHRATPWVSTSHPASVSMGGPQLPSSAPPRTRLAVGRVPTAESPGAESSKCRSAGSSSQRAAYVTIPNPPIAVAIRNAARIHSTGTPRCRASPDATPPTRASSRLRKARRGESGAPAYGGTEAGRGWFMATSIVTQPSPRPMRLTPDRTLTPITPGAVEIRVLPDGGPASGRQ